jgi:hypothetical protein
MNLKGAPNLKGSRHKVNKEILNNIGSLLAPKTGSSKSKFGLARSRFDVKADITLKTLLPVPLLALDYNM